MDKKKRNIIILVILCILLVVVGVFVFIDLFFRNNTDNLINNDILSEDNINNIDENGDNNQYTDEIILENNDVIDNDNLYVNNDGKDIADDYSDNYINESSKDNYGEDDVIGYFENLEYEVKNSTSYKEKFKEYFITIIDFIFYGSEIKGYTFDDLTDTAKAKIIAIALKMDAKIEEYIPGYKESISSTTGKIYNDIKERLVTSYMDISSAICKENNDGCNKVKEIFSDVKDYCKIGWDFIKGLFKNGAAKIKDWYEIYSGK